jgi:hypothetical protein
VYIDTNSGRDTGFVNVSIITVGLVVSITENRWPKESWQIKIKASNVLSFERDPEECDARDDDSSTVAGLIKQNYGSLSFLVYMPLKQGRSQNVGIYPCIPA